MVWFFCEACGILAPRPGIEPAPPALEGEVLTTGPPGKSADSVLSISRFTSTDPEISFHQPAGFLA